MFIDELKDYIVAQTSLVFGTDLFIGNMPEGINNCVVLQQGNSDNVYQHGDTLGYVNTNIVIRIRGGQTENTARSLASTIASELDNLTYQHASYNQIRGAFETPFYQLDGTDQNNNYIYVGVYNVFYEITSS
jgi:Bacteriophage minor capsid protein